MRRLKPSEEACLFSGACTEQVSAPRPGRCCPAKPGPPKGGWEELLGGMRRHQVWSLTPTQSHCPQHSRGTEDRKELFLGSPLPQSVPGHTCSWLFAFVCVSLALTCFLFFSSQPLTSISALIYFRKITTSFLVSLFIFTGGGERRDLFPFCFHRESLLLPFFFPHPANEAH